MKNIHKTQGFSIILAMGLTLLFSMIGLYLMEYMIPFSRNVKGVENSSSAFYQSYGALENALYYLSQNDIGDEDNSPYSGGEVDFSYNITGSGTQIPLTGKGDSEFNNDFNQISQGNPIQLVVGKGKISAITLSLQTPNFDGVGGPDSLTGTGHVFWQLSSANKSLSVETPLNVGSNQNLWFSDGIKAEDQSGPRQTFSNFYTSQCSGPNECVLKILLIQALVNNVSGAKLPYIEYQISTSGRIPMRESSIIAEGKSNGYVKNLEVHVPQLTTNSAFDFTVFQ